MKNLFSKVIYLLFFQLAGIPAFSQTEVIEIDSLSLTASKVMPFNRDFTVRVKIASEHIRYVHLIKRKKYFDFGGTILSGGQPIEMPAHHFRTEKIGDDNYLLINFTDKFTLEPSSSYFIVAGLSEIDAGVVSFLEHYYFSIDTSLEKEKQELHAKDFWNGISGFSEKMRKLLGDGVQYDYYSDSNYFYNERSFRREFSTQVLPAFQSYFDARKIYDQSLDTQAVDRIAESGMFDIIGAKQLLVDTTINNAALQYFIRQNFWLNDYTSDYHTLFIQNGIKSLLNGSISLACILCNPINTSSHQKTDIRNRINNIERSIQHLNEIKKALFLLRPKNSSQFKVERSIVLTVDFMNRLQGSKLALQRLFKLRMGIESAILEAKFPISTSQGQEVFLGFKESFIVSGNSYLNFETRNKALLNPDFGFVSSAITNKGQKLEYGVIPYLGVQVNFMAVDRDLIFSSYRKNWKQRLSFMLGWSMVSMKQDSSYDNFFERSSLLTGIGFRVNNTVRVVGGTQWLFKYAAAGGSKELLPLPYIGLSIDLNVKQYLNGFVDLLSGIGKTKVPQKSIPDTTPN